MISDIQHEDRHAHEAHARRAHVEDGHEEVQRRRDGRHAEHLQAQHPEVDARTRRILARGQVGVAEPARVGRAAQQEADVEHDPAEDERPVAEGVQARERDVARADLQRQDEVEEGGAQRHDRQEDHRRGVHREQRVEHLRADQRVVGRPQLQADDQRFEAADDEEGACRDAVQDADALVVDGGEPAPQPAVQGWQDLGGMKDDDALMRGFRAMSGRACDYCHSVRMSPQSPIVDSEVQPAAAVELGCEFATVRDPSARR